MIDSGCGRTRLPGSFPRAARGMDDKMQTTNEVGFGHLAPKPFKRFGRNQSSLQRIPLGTNTHHIDTEFDLVNSRNRYNLMIYM